MHNVAMAQRALDMAAGAHHERSTFGKPLADRQAVQFMLADCASELYIARLMLLHIAYKAEKGMDIRQENSIAKVFLAHMVHKVVDTAIQLHGALGYSQDTPLAALVHADPLAAAGRRSGRGAPLDDRPERHQGVPRAWHHGERGGRGFAVTDPSMALDTEHPSPHSAKFAPDCFGRSLHPS